MSVDGISSRVFLRALESRLFFYLLPHVCARLTANGFRQYPADPVVLVVTPLKLLMRDQVAILKRKGFAVVFVGESDSSDAATKTGKFPCVYGSPDREVLVGSREWQCALQVKELRERFMAVVASGRSSHSNSVVRKNPVFSLRFVVI